MNPEMTEPTRLKLTQRKRQAIVEAALLEFDEGGFQATSMDQIAGRANVSKRTVYNHFSSKDELFEAIRSDLFSQIAGIDCEYNSSSPLREQLEAIAARQVELLCSDAFVKFARISVPLSLRSPRIAETTFDAFHESNKAIANFVRQATLDGRLNVDDPKFAVRQFVGLLNANVLWPQLVGNQRMPSRAQKKRIVETTAAMFLCHFASPSQDGQV